MNREENMSPLINEEMSHQPLYLQIKEALKKQILEGDYAPFDRLPSESTLMETFGVSRITVRQSLRDLQSEGLIFSSQGKGSFVSKPKAMQDVQYLEGLSEAMTPMGYETAAKLLSIREVKPIKDVQKNLNITGKDGVIEVVRVRYLNREAISVDTSYFPMAIGQKLFARDLSGDIFPLLENELGIPLGCADINLEARSADGDTASLLAMDAGDPIMWVQRLVHDVDKNPVDYEYLAFRGDAYKYRFRINRNASKHSDF
jgi:GntR family transcriptional regulator